MACSKNIQDVPYFIIAIKYHYWYSINNIINEMNQYWNIYHSTSYVQKVKSHLDISLIRSLFSLLFLIIKVWFKFSPPILEKSLCLRPFPWKLLILRNFLEMSFILRCFFGGVFAVWKYDQIKNMCSLINFQFDHIFKLQKHRQRSIWE